MPGRAIRIGSGMWLEQELPWLRFLAPENATCSAKCPCGHMTELFKTINQLHFLQLQLLRLLKYFLFVARIVIWAVYQDSWHAITIQEGKWGTQNLHLANIKKNCTKLWEKMVFRPYKPTISEQCFYSLTHSTTGPQTYRGVGILAIQ